MQAPELAGDRPWLEREAPFLAPRSVRRRDAATCSPGRRPPASFAYLFTSRLLSTVKRVRVCVYKLHCTRRRRRRWSTVNFSQRTASRVLGMGPGFPMMYGTDRFTATTSYRWWLITDNSSFRWSALLKMKLSQVQGVFSGLAHEPAMIQRLRAEKGAALSSRNG